MRNPDAREVHATLLGRGLQIFDYVRSQRLLFEKQQLFEAIFDQTADQRRGDRGNSAFSYSFLFTSDVELRK